MTFSHRWILSGVLALCLIAMGGCHGERLTTVIEKPDELGRWRFDGTLIRSYNVTLEQGYEAILKLAGTKGWVVRDRNIANYKASVTVKTTQLVMIEFTVWAPAGQATDIGIEYAGGDKVGSSLVFMDLERVLPGKRITVN